MKSQIEYFLIIPLTGLYLGCNNPQPNALVEAKDPLEIEVINKNSEELKSFEVDSTWSRGSPAKFASIISVTRAKTLIQGMSFKTSFTHTVYFDQPKPIIINNGMLLGFKTLAL